MQEYGWALSPPDVHRYQKQESPEIKEEYKPIKREETPGNGSPGSSTRRHPHHQESSGSYPRRPKREASPLEHEQESRRIKREPADEGLGNIPMHPRGGSAAQSFGHPLLGRFSYRQRAIYGLA